MRAFRWLLAMAAAIALPCLAAIPLTLNYQGYLTALPAGTAVNGNVVMTFRIYNVSSGGAALWTETQLAVPVTNGTFNAVLGSVTPFPGSLAFAEPYWLSVAVGSDPEMTPRQPLSASAYAIRAATADSLAATSSVASSQITGQVTGGQLASNLTLAGTTSGTFSGPLTGNVTGNVTGNAATATKLATPRNINGVPFDGTADITLPPAVATGCPGPRIAGTCLLSYTNAQATGFVAAAQACANQGGDICTDSQQWPLFSAAILSGPHWTASFADNDSSAWGGANGGTADDHPANSSYAYACCGGYTPSFPSIAVLATAGVRTTAIHNVADTTFAGAVAYCGALHSDICSDSQTFILRKAGMFSVLVPTWTNSHADNDGTNANLINGSTSDDPFPSQTYGFACCPSRRPADLSCPVARTNGVCAVSIHNTADATFEQAAEACAALGGADLCSTAQSSVLRNVGALSVALNWTNSHSDNDGGNASVGVGAMADNPLLTTPAGYACCLN